MNKNQEWKVTHGSFVYELNDEGSNKWYFGVQSGFDDNGNRASEDVLRDVALMCSAAPDLYRALQGLVSLVSVLDGEKCHCEMREARAALAKAEGHGDE